MHLKRKRREHPEAKGEKKLCTVALPNPTSPKGGLLARGVLKKGKQLARLHRGKDPVARRKKETLRLKAVKT